MVKADERETTGERALLNFGHTFGHAYEKLAGFDGRLLHGEAVSLGMVKAFQLSRALGLCHGQDVGRAMAHLERLGMPVRPSDLELDGFDTEAVLTRDACRQEGRKGEDPLCSACGVSARRSAG